MFGSTALSFDLFQATCICHPPPLRKATPEIGQLEDSTLKIDLFELGQHKPWAELHPAVYRVVL